MVHKVKKYVGNIKRAIFGLLQNHRESIGYVPKDLSPIVIGQTSTGGAIECFAVGAGPRNLLFVSGIHGNEIGTVKLAHRLIQWLQVRRVDYPEFTFLIIPSLNPDGLAKAKEHPDYWHGGLKGRFNNNGVDLNRNFPTPSFQSWSTWGRGKNYAESIQVFCGDYGGSESEIQSLIKLIYDRKPELYLAFHNVAAGIMGSNDTKAQMLTDKFSEASGYARETIEEWIALKQTGTAKEWCDLNHVSYLESEGRYRWASDWEHQKLGVEAVLEKLKSM